MRKILGTENPADLMTKYLARSATDTHFGFLNQRRESGRAKSGLNIQGNDQTSTGKSSTATGDVLSTCVVDDWLRATQPHQGWPEPWIGETHFEATDGIPRSVRHTSARRALMTPLNNSNLRLPLGVKGTGARCTAIHPITRAQARGNQPSAKTHYHAREDSGDQPADSNREGQEHKRRAQAQRESTLSRADWPSETRVPPHGRMRS